MNTSKFLLFGLSITLLGASSCKKDKPVDPPVVVEKKGITLSIRPTWNGADMQFLKLQYVKPDGEAIMLRTWGMIIAKLSLVKDDNTEVLLGDGYQWIDFGTGRTSFNYANAPAGNYKGIKFQLGPDSLINHGDPTIWPSTHPLNGNLTGLHWGWAGGYIFQAFDGEWKDSLTATTTKGFSFHTAGDQFRTSFFMPYTFSLEGKHKTANLEFRAEEYFINPLPIALKDKASSHSEGAAEIALMKKLIGNAADVYRINSVQ